MLRYIPEVSLHRDKKLEVCRRLHRTYVSEPTDDQMNFTQTPVDPHRRRKYNFGFSS